MKQEKVYTVAFEGAHRVGKGTQIELLSNKLNNCGIPCLTIRGDGSRRGSGEQIGDPASFWWRDMWKDLHDPTKPKNLWNTAAFRLAKELLTWRDKTFPDYLKNLDYNYGIILIDRSLLSRTMIPRELTNNEHLIDLYPEQDRYQNGRAICPPINIEDVCPDLIFELIAPKEVLLDRIDPLDPKKEFREKLLQERYDWYMSSTEYLPKEVQEKVVRIDSSRDIDTIHNEIVNNVDNCFDFNI